MFESLKELDPAGKTSWVDMPELGEGARIQVTPASESNAPYFNAVLRKYGNERKSKIKVRKAANVTAADLDSSRQEDRDMFGLHIIVGWENVKKPPAKGEGFVSFTRELAKELCQFLPSWLFDRVRLHAADMQNFLPEDREPDPSVPELAKNSESGSVSI